MDAAKKVPGRAFCPNCGQKYAVPEAELRRRPGIRFRASCRLCDTAFSVWWQDDGLATEVEEVLDEPVSPRDVLKTGARIGNYELEDALASGGSATVYSAYDWGANRKVALKVLHREPDSDYGLRFRREVEVQGNLKHQNLMPIFDHGIHEGKPYYTMELLHKPTTFDTVVALFRGGRLAYNPTLKGLGTLEAMIRRVLLPVARAIAFANQNGVIHRDLKPSNVIVDAKTLRVYVIDFGICHLFKSAGSRLVLRAGEKLDGDDEERRMTMGTIRCMPPEQAKGSVSPRGDVWALGALLYYILRGDFPVAAAIDLGRVGLEKRVANLEKLAASCRSAGDEKEAAFYDARVEEIRAGAHRTMKDLLRDAQTCRYVPLPHGADPSLAAIVQRAMAPGPDDRYADAAAFADELHAWLDGRTVRAYAAALGRGKSALYRSRLYAKRNRGVLVTAVVVSLVGLVVAALLLVRAESQRERDIAQWLFDARRTEEPSEQEQLLRRVLAVRPGHEAAKDLLATVRAYTPLLARVREARRTRREIKDLIKERRIEEAKKRAADMAAVLEGSVVPDLQKLPEDFAGRRLVGEAQRLVDQLRQRIIATVKGVPSGVEVLLATPHSRASLEFDWEGAHSWGTAPLPIPGRPLETGSFVMLLRAPGGAVLHLPFAIPFRTDPRPIDIHCPIDPARIPSGMVYVAGAKGFEYGDLRFSEETERVTVAPFFLDHHEVTNADYATFLATLEPRQRTDAVPRRLLRGAAGRTAPLWEQQADGTWAAPAAARDHPVTGVSLLDAQAYARWAGKRLPTPQEWELAARGVDGRDYPFGLKLDRGACNAASGAVARIGGFPRDRSPYGAFDMGGNVAEWTDGPGGASAIVKGGSFELPRYRAMAAAFGKRRADLPYPDVGFRCARDAD